MVIVGMRHFQNVCQKKLVEWYNKNRPETQIDLGDVFASSAASIMLLNLQTNFPDIS